MQVETTAWETAGRAFDRSKVSGLDVGFAT
jgi:hypothetical protein